MFMERIEVATAVAASPPRPEILKVGVGFLFIIAAVPLMLGWTAMLLMWLLIAALTGATTGLLTIARYAGEEIVGH